MGIKDLKKFSTSNAPDSIMTIPLRKFKGSRLAVDAELLMYNKMHSVNKSLYKLLDLKNNPDAKIDSMQSTSLLMSRLLDWVVTITSYGISPVFVFDGRYKPGKERIQAERKSTREKTNKDTADIVSDLVAVLPHERSDEDVVKLRSKKQNSVYVTSVQINLFKNVLRMMRIPVITARADGEDLCCTLAVMGKVSAVYSKDADCVVTGAPITISGITLGSSSPNHTFDVIVYDKLLEGLGVTREGLIDMCVLYGCDYSVGVKGYGLITAHKKIKEYGCIENIPGINTGDIDVPMARDSFRVKSVKECMDECHEDILPNLNIDKRSFDNHSLRPFMESYSIANYIMQLKSSFRNITVFEDRGAEYVLDEGRILRYGAVNIKLTRPDVVDTPKPQSHIGEIKEDSIFEAMGIQPLSFK
jgi:5'-3' exonuclease